MGGRPGVVCGLTAGVGGETVTVPALDRGLGLGREPGGRAVAVRVVDVAAPVAMPAANAPAVGPLPVD
ncbi:hypothetical protein [Actinoplanes regularis]|uniref:hypothetical protein n=1 Tax=Actinoplanes regularis TaxID=52697 RepID=UPI0024A43A56|nr:hypothetical protein [Actinoplanes regularis]GLW35477.1 hypothetical protein Areg01_84120 [Actinoplanes regularis]